MSTDWFDSVVTYSLYLVFLLIGNGLGLHQRVDLLALIRSHLVPLVRQACHQGCVGWRRCQDRMKELTGK